jgi:hypothetical protein
MINYIGGVPLPIGQMWRVETVEIGTALILLDQKQIRKIKTISERARIERRSYGSVDVDFYLFERNFLLGIRLDALRHRKLRRELNGRMFSAAHTVKRENRQVALHLLQIAPIPIPQLAFLIEKSNGTPFALVADEFRALNRRSRIENAIEIRLSKSAEDPFQLYEKFSAVLASWA